MKKVLLVIIFLGFIFILSSRTSYAQMMGSFNPSSDTDEIQDRPLGGIVSELLSKYKSDTITKLNCNQISEDDMEKLGDAVMSEMHPNQNVHNAMDNMMGGEGSQSLKQAHISMAKNYLGCGYRNSQNGYGMIGNFNYNSSGGYNGYGMMGGLIPMFAGYNTVTGGVYQVLFVVTWIAVITFLLTGARWFWKNSGGKK